MNNSPPSGIADNDTVGQLVLTSNGLLAFGGRIGRMKFFWVQVVTLCVVMVVGVVMSVIARANLNIGLVLALALPPVCIALYVSYVAGVKRCHDLDKSGWLYLLIAIPVVGSIFSLYLLFAKGAEQNNKYGISLYPKVATHSRPLPPTRAAAAASDGLAHSEVPSSSFSTSSSKVSYVVRPIVTASNIPSEDMWAAAIAEFDSVARRHGLWARSFSESQGDEGAAKANYLRYRTDELQYENATALEQQMIDSMMANIAVAEKNDLLSGNVLAPSSGLNVPQTISAVTGAVILAALIFFIFSPPKGLHNDSIAQQPLPVVPVETPLPTISQMPSPFNSSDADVTLKIPDGKETQKPSEPKCNPRTTIADAKKLYPFLDGYSDNDIIDVLHEGKYRDLPREQVAGTFCVKPLMATN